MAHMDPETIERLELAACKLGPDHKVYLKEAAHALREGGPIDALRLLNQLGDSAFCRRPDQKSALAGVFGWLFDRVRREPTVPADQLALELGWLRRLVVVHGRRGGPPLQWRQRRRELDRLAAERSKRLLDATPVAPTPPEPEPEPEPISIEQALRLLRQDGGRHVAEIRRWIEDIGHPDEAERKAVALAMMTRKNLKKRPRYADIRDWVGLKR